MQRSFMLNVEKTLRANYPQLFNKPPIVSKTVVKFFKMLFHENAINEFLSEHNQTGLAFIDEVLAHQEISYKMDNKELQNIPSQGKVIIVANHPLGAMDAFALIDMVASVRQNKKVKIVANQLLAKLSNLSDIIIPVDNFSDKLTKKSLMAIEEALNNEEAVIFFPAGEVSRAGLTGVKDGKWKTGFIKFSKKTSAPILPIHINAKNSKLFYFLSMIYKPLGSLMLSHEMLAARNSSFEFKIGKLVSSETISHMNMSNKEHAKLFRRHLYRITKPKKRPIYPTESCIVHPQNPQLVKQELLESERIGTTTDNKHIYMVEYGSAPTLMLEIGRLREYSFRKVGEGSGKAKDLDRYDEYYQHLVLWDDDALEVVGAYRIGDANWILSWLGKEGIYMNELCKITEEFEEILFDAIELGRSFVQPKYWGSRALDYLWQGIGAYLSHNPQIKYMYGPVSLSNSYPQAAKEAIVYFYLTYFNGQDMNLLYARSQFRLSKSRIEELVELFKGDDYLSDFRTLKEYLKAFSVTVPTLYKQYSELCENDGMHFLDFGIDADFNDCIDGYILVDVRKIKAAKRKRYITDNI